MAKRTVKRKSPTSAEELFAASARLNLLCDEAADKVKAIEVFLSTKCHLGIAAYTLVSEGNTPLQSSLYLEYRRIGTQFRIAVVWARPDGEDEKVSPWSDCNRDDKLLTFKYIPSLLGAIAEKVHEKIDEAEEALKSADSALASFIDKEA